MKKIMILLVTPLFIFCLFIGCAKYGFNSGSYSESSPSSDKIFYPATSDIDESQHMILQKQAKLLTTHIIEKALVAFDEASPLTALSNREIFNFLATIYPFYEETAHPYLQYAQFANDPYPVVSIKNTDAQMLVYQLFGISDWGFDAPDCYNEELQEYCFSLETGLPSSPYSCRISTDTTTDENKIVVDFDLADNVDFVNATSEAVQEYGSFQMEFEILFENGAAFLRFRELRPN